jgi:hypothetical protein
MTVRVSVGVLRAVSLLAVLCAAEASATISWCEQKPGATPGTPHSGLAWICDCSGQCAKELGDPPSEGAPRPQADCGTVGQFTVTGCPDLCGLAGTQQSPVSCGTDECDDSVCIAPTGGSGGPRFTLGVNPATGTLSNVPICQHFSKCGSGAARAPNGEQQQCRLGGLDSIGDPASLSDGASLFSWVDFSLNTDFGKFEFQRSFTSNSSTWASAGGLSTLPKPFGASYARPHSANWTHSLYSFVQTRTDPSEYVVRRWDGSVLRFTTGCAQGTFSTPKGEALEAQASLFCLTNDKFILTDGGRRYYFQDVVGEYTFLTKIAPATWRTAGASGARDQTILALNYQVPGLVSSAVLGDGRQLVFTYKPAVALPGVEQLLSEVALKSSASASASVPLVSYEYRGAIGGLVSKVSFGAGGTQGFQYPLTTSGPGCTITTCPILAPVGTFSVTRNGSPWFEHDWVGGRVQTIREAVDGTLRTTWSALALSSGAVTCPADTSCVRARRTTATAGAILTGDGSATPTSEIRSSVLVSTAWSATPRVASSSSAAGSSAWTWMSPTGAAGSATVWVPYTSSTPMHATTQYVWEPPLGGSPARAILSASIDPASRRTDYEWVEGDVGHTPNAREQLKRSERRPSVLSASGVAETIYNWDTATNRLKSEIRTGYTYLPNYQFGTWATGQRFIGTFYFTRAACLGATVDDPEGRVTEVHGPCFVGSATATDCEAGDQVEVTSYRYDGTTNNLSEVDRFPNAVFPLPVPLANASDCGLPHTTKLQNYDELGHPRLVIDPNLVRSWYVWSNGRLDTVTVMTSGQSTLGTWSYIYDNEKLTAVRNPDGAFSVTCYRTFDTVKGCDYTTPFSSVVRATAIAPNSDGRGFSEATVFAYGADGKLRETKWLDASGAVRKRQVVERNVAGDLTYERIGSMPRTTRVFDADHRLRGLGDPYASSPQWGTAQAPDFCGGLNAQNSPVSSYCSAVFGYNLAGELTSMVDDSEHACLGYDDHGNLKKLSSPCSSASPTSWTHDDFGNVVEMSAEWLTGSTFMAWNARGQLVAKQLPSMAGSSLLANAYDGFGRLLRTSQVSTRGSEILVDQVWDGDLNSRSYGLWFSYYGLAVRCHAIKLGDSLGALMRPEVRTSRMTILEGLRLMRSCPEARRSAMVLRPRDIRIRQAVA